MKFRLLVPLLALFGAASFAHPAFGRDDVPQWLTDVAHTPTPAYAAKAPGIVLFQSADVSVEEGGKIVTTERYALRVLNRQGREWARVTKVYMADTGRIRDLRAWVIAKDDNSLRLGKERTEDMGLVADALYAQIRARSIDGTRDCLEGQIFGYESVTEEKSIFTQLTWDFQDRLPVVDSRYNVHVPSGWSTKALTLNHAPLPQLTDVGGGSWELRDLPYIEEEPAGPPVTAIAPRLAISLFPAPGAHTSLGATFANWTDVSVFAAGLQDPQSQPDDAIRAKVAALTAGAKTEIDKIRAIGVYVQNIKYVSVQTGLGRGGGYVPHPASFVFAKSYGDCKDKANLMRAMLRAANITSYPVLIYAGDPRYVREEWPSPQQFNHCILAIALSQPLDLPAVIKHPTLGNILIFDSTEDNTPLGELPIYEQTSLALIAAGPKGVLLRMPEATPAANRIERKTELELTAGGSIQGRQEEDYFGDAAVHARAQFRHRERPAYIHHIESWMTAGVQGVNVSKVDPVDNLAGDEFRLAVDFSAPRYGQLVQNRLLLFRPGSAPRRGYGGFPNMKRKYPVVIDAEKFEETVHVKLPEGFEIDELPGAGKLDGDFGRFESKCTAAGTSLTCVRSLEVKAQTVPAAQYSGLKEFFEQVAGAEAQPVVLVKK